MKKIHSFYCMLISIFSLTVASCQSQSVSSSNNIKLGNLRRYCPWIETLKEEDIDNVSYQIKKHDYQGDYSFCDYLETYVSNGQDDIRTTYQFLKACSIQKFSSNPYRIYVDKSVTFSVVLKNQKRLDIYGTDGYELYYVYEDSNLVKINSNSGNIRESTFLSMPLPIMSKLYGYSYNKSYFKNTTIQDKMNDFQYVNHIDATKLVDALFVPDNTFNVSSTLNDYNRYFISSNSEGTIEFENSKCFRIMLNSTEERGRYRIINDFSFENLFVGA